MPDENTTIEYKQLLDNGEPFYPMVGKSSYSEWIGYEDVTGEPPSGNYVTEIPNGGTGADNAMDARVNLGVDANGIASMFATQYTSSSSTSESLTYINENHTVSGNGVVWVTATISTDDTSTYGSTQAYILWNFNTMARTQFRYPSAYAQAHAASVSVAIKVSNGDTITLRMGSTRGGTKYFYRIFTCLGCTIS